MLPRYPERLPLRWEPPAVEEEVVASFCCYCFCLCLCFWCWPWLEAVVAAAAAVVVAVAAFDVVVAASAAVVAAAAAEDALDRLPAPSSLVDAFLGWEFRHEDPAAADLGDEPMPDAFDNLMLHWWKKSPVSLRLQQETFESNSSSTLGPHAEPP